MKSLAGKWLDRQKCVLCCTIAVVLHVQNVRCMCVCTALSFIIMCLSLSRWRVMPYTQAVKPTSVAFGCGECSLCQEQEFSFSFCLQECPSLLIDVWSALLNWIHFAQPTLVFLFCNFFSPFSLRFYLVTVALHSFSVSCLVFLSVACGVVCEVRRAHAKKKKREHPFFSCFFLLHSQFFFFFVGDLWPFFFFLSLLSFRDIVVIWSRNFLKRRLIA